MERNYSVWMEAYRTSSTDVEAGKKVGVGGRTFESWRHQNNIKPIRRHGLPLAEYREPEPTDEWKVYDLWPELEVTRSGWCRRSGAIYRPKRAKTGYRLLTIRGVVQVALHRIMCHVFLGPVPAKHCVNHINGIKGDDRIENLEYVTRSQNSLHYLGHKDYKTRESETAKKRRMKCLTF